MAKEAKKKKKETTEVTEEVKVETPESVEEQVVEAPEISKESTAPTPEVTEQKSQKKESPKKEKTAKKKAVRSAKYQASTKLVDKSKTYPIVEALDLVKKTSYTKFDGAVDVHVRLTPSKKAYEVVRGTVSLPHGTGKERRVVIITEELIEKIEKGFLDFDVAVATPEMMPKLAKLARVLGPKGLMPNPKSGTVSSEPEKAAAELKGGRIEYKTDTLGNIHQSIGKVSWPSEKLSENYEALLGALPKGRIRSVTIAPSMGAGIKVAP